MTVDAALDAIANHGAQQKRAELAWLLAEVKEVQRGGGILEIGVAEGGTLNAFMSLGVKVVGIDREPPPYRHGAHLVIGDSHAHETWVQAKAWGPFDALFIDGDHTQSGVTQDYERYRGLVRLGGLVAFHDVAEHNPATGCQVRRLWEQLVREMPGRTKEFIEPPVDWGGVGILYG